MLFFCLKEKKTMKFLHHNLQLIDLQEKIITTEEEEKQKEKRKRSKCACAKLEVDELLETLFFQLMKFYCSWKRIHCNEQSRVSYVYKAQDIQTQQFVCLKFVFASNDYQVPDEVVTLENFRRTTNNINKNIQQILDLYSWCHVWIIVTKFHENEEYVKSYDWPNYMYQILRTLTWLHEVKAFIHLDVKPSNVLWDSIQAQVCLIDFENCTPLPKQHKKEEQEQQNKLLDVVDGSLSNKEEICESPQKKQHCISSSSQCLNQPQAVELKTAVVPEEGSQTCHCENHKNEQLDFELTTESCSSSCCCEEAEFFESRDIFGTEGFIAPEMLAHSRDIGWKQPEEVTEKVDVFSAGCLLGCLLFNISEVAIRERTVYVWRQLISRKKVKSNFEELFLHMVEPDVTTRWSARQCMTFMQEHFFIENT